MLWRDIVGRPFSLVFFGEVTIKIARQCLYREAPITWITNESIRVWRCEENVDWSQIAMYDSLPHRVAFHCTSVEK